MSDKKKEPTRGFVCGGTVLVEYKDGAVLQREKGKPTLFRTPEGKILQGGRAAKAARQYTSD
jgi:hypothetical protein